MVSRDVGGLACDAVGVSKVRGARLWWVNVGSLKQLRQLDDARVLGAEHVPVVLDYQFAGKDDLVPHPVWISRRLHFEPQLLEAADYGLFAAGELISCERTAVADLVSHSDDGL